MTSIKVNLKEVVANPAQYGNTVQIPILAALIRKANEFYYNSDKLVFSDEVYDILKEALQERSPDNPVLKEIGSNIIVGENDRTELPFHMGSMSKIKDKNSIQTWMQTYMGPYIISDKLDGVSGLLVYSQNKYTLYSRGNSEYGRNITPLAAYLNLPTLNADCVIRGEIIMSKLKFDKYCKLYSEARSLVNGICRTAGISNYKNLKPERASDVDFVAYELIKPERKPSEQFSMLKKMGFKTANTSMSNIIKIQDWGIDNSLEGGFLFNTLIKHRADSEYEIDGIIITEDKLHQRNTSGNPKYSFAFKVNGVGKETEVLEVEWNPSKHGQIIPRIKIKPIELGGITVQHTTGFHAKYIVVNKIGPGAILRVVRSGDVIPHIIEIVKPAEEPQLPDIEYEWTNTNVHILVKNPNNNEAIHLKRLVSFFTCLGVDNLSRGTIIKMINSGYNTIYKILSMKVTDFLKLPGIKDRMANKLYNNIHKIIDEPIYIPKVMTASLKFGHGFGQKRFEAILDRYPEILDMEHISVDMISEIPGFQKTTAKRFLTNFQQFLDFLEELPMIKLKPYINVLSESIGDLFLDKQVVMTGFRDEVIEEFIKLNGGSLGNSISNKTKLVIAKEIDGNSIKLQKANSLGIQTTSLNQFKDKYNL